MKTKEFIHAQLLHCLPDGESIPPFTAVESLLCEAIDRLVPVPIKQPILTPHEHACFDDKMRKVEHAISEELHTK